MLCRVLQGVAVCCSVYILPYTFPYSNNVLRCVAVRCGVLQCHASANILPYTFLYSNTVLHRGAVWCSVVQCVAVCCSVLQCAATCCSVLQCVAECCSVLQSVYPFMYVATFTDSCGHKVTSHRSCHIGHVT